MLGRKQEGKVAGKNPRPYQQLGLLDIPDFDDVDIDMGDNEDDEDDEELERELMALEAGIDVRKYISRQRVTSELEQPRAVKRSAGPTKSSDEDDVDENDPELLAELGAITSTNDKAILRPAPLPPSAARPVPVIRTRPQSELKAPAIPTKMNVTPTMTTQVQQLAPPAEHSLLSLLEERTEMYRLALNNAKSAANSLKARRIERGLKALESLVKAVKSGKDINEEDIPLPVAIGGGTSNTVPDHSSSVVEEPMAPPVPPRSRPAPTTQTKEVPTLPTPAQLPQAQISDTVTSPGRVETRNMLVSRRDQYKQAALHAKALGNQALTISYIKIAKKFDNVINALDQGQPVDLAGMPQSPPENQDMGSAAIRTPQNPAESFPVNTVQLDENELAIPSDLECQTIFNAPPPPSDTLDALQQRLQKYQCSCQEANASGNERKARQMGRIVKQYETAIKAYKMGKPVNYDELPNPPGYAPIPGHTAAMAASTPPKIDLEAKAQPLPAIVSTTSDINTNKVTTSAVLVPPAGPAPAAPPRAAKTDSKNGPRAPQSANDKQKASLIEGQMQFKAAALEAKKRGDIQAAKEYLRLARGFIPMITASSCGLPVNMDSLPTLPQVAQEANDFEIVGHQDCQTGGTHQELCAKLEKELLSQIDMCNRTLKHYVELGDVPNAKKFKTMLQHSQKDLEVVQYAQKNGDSVPKFHYESRTFSIVQCCTDLGDDELEVHIIRGIHYSCPNPKAVDTYVKFEFPYPTDNRPREKTATIRDTNNPEYNAVFKVSIPRKSRTFARVLKRHVITFEIWIKGGFLRSDTLLGSAPVKLVGLETKCIIHNSYDVMDNRKPIGGKLEVKIRVRDPFLNKEVETITEKWLVIGEQRRM